MVSQQEECVLRVLKILILTIICSEGGKMGRLESRVKGPNGFGLKLVLFGRGQMGWVNIYLSNSYEYFNKYGKFKRLRVRGKDIHGNMTF